MMKMMLDIISDNALFIFSFSIFGFNKNAVLRCAE